MAERPVLWDVVEEHLDEAGFLWERWERALLSPSLRARQVADGDEARLLAHVDGLVVAGPRAIDRLLEPALRQGEPGAAAAAAHALLELPGGLARWRAVHAGGAGARRHSMARALALSRRPSEPELTALLSDGHPWAVVAGLEALALRRIDAGPSLSGLLASRDPALAAAALHAAPWSNQPVRALIERALERPEAAVREAALEAGLRLGFGTALTACRRLVEGQEPVADRALALLALGGDADDEPLLLRAAAVSSLRAPALVALGYAGRVGAVEVLLGAMEQEPREARLAGEAFTAITGIPIAGELVAEAEPASEPSSLEADDLDASLAPTPEAELPVPEPHAVARAWSARTKAFDSARRYLLGSPFTAEGLLRAFAESPMRRRALLALELAVRSGGGYAVEPRDFAFQQLRSAQRQERTTFPGGSLPFSRLLRS